MEIVISLGIILFSTFLIAKACDGFEVAADHLGRNLSEGVKGASINAIGSSMPELFATFVFLFLFNETSGFAGGIGTTAGSAVFNTMIIPAVTIIAAIRMFKLSSINVSKKVILRDGLMLIAVEFILIVTIGEKLQWWHGLMLMLLYVGYSGYMFLSMGKNNEDSDTEVNEVEENEVEEKKLDDRKKQFIIDRMISFVKLNLEDAIISNQEITEKKAWILLSIATTIIAVACYALVYGCELFGETMGIQGYFVAVILAAAASSVPDTILSVKDARKGNYDDAVANALGSNIFDICFALGLPLFLYTIINGPIVMPGEMVEHISELRILLFFLTIGAFFLFFFGSGMDNKKAIGLKSLYAVFTIFIIARAYEQSWVEPFAEKLHLVQSYLQ